MALALVVLWLASYRLTRLVVADAFPPAAAARAAVERRFGDESSWAYLVNCPWCTGIYVSALAVAGWDLFVGDLVAPLLIVGVVASAVGITADILNVVNEFALTLRGAQRALPAPPPDEE